MMIPENVKPLINQFSSELEQLPTDLIKGVYLYGSIALGSFEKERSDIDFVVVFNRPIQEDEVKTLENIHENLRQHPYGNRFDGVYIKEENLGKSNYELDPYFYISEGSLEKGHWDINAVTWWIMKHHGITVKGTPVEELSLHVEWSDVQKAMRYNIEHYWKEKKLQQFLEDDWVLSCVETNVRILCTMKKGEIIPKTKAMQEAKDWIGEDWHPVLDEALRIRFGNEEESYFSSMLMRAQTVVNFTDYIRSACEPYFATSKQ